MFVCLHACVLCLWAFCVCVYVCACGALHPSIDACTLILILQIIRCSERYYEPGKFHGRGEYEGNASISINYACTYICMQTMHVHIRMEHMQHINYACTWIIYVCDT